MEAVILAGGLGTRLRGVVTDRPKPMALIHGRPFLEHLMDYWQTQKITRFILAVGYQREKIREYFKDEYKKTPIAYSVEKEPLGTGGALLQAAEFADAPGPLLVLNGDTFFEVSLDSLKNGHKSAKADVSIAVRNGMGEKRYETLRLDAQGRIQEIQPRGTAGASEWINGGVYLFEPKILRGLGSEPDQKISLEDEICPRLLREHKNCFALRSTGRFIDIGSPESYAAAEAFFKETRK